MVREKRKEIMNTCISPTQCVSFYTIIIVTCISEEYKSHGQDHHQCGKVGKVTLQKGIKSEGQ